MTEATISYLKQHLSKVVHRAEQGEDIQITRHGKPVAVIVSQEKYHRAFASGNGIFSSYLTWREQHPDAEGFTKDELVAMRDKVPHEIDGFRWDE